MNLFDTKNYEVKQVVGVTGEDGKLNSELEGYAVVNKNTKVVEFSGTILPEAMYRATYFNDMLESITNPEAVAAESGPIEDVVQH